VRVDVRGLSKSFGAVKAVSDLSFSVEPGSVTGFLGPNGAGKTTTMRMLLGLERPDAGTATFDDKPYASLPEPVRTVGAVLETAFHPARSGRNHLRVYCRAAGLPTSRADETLHQVGLADAGDRRAGTYSLGMRQRLGLGAALLGDPQILILDEPANGLDPQGIRWLRDFLRAFAAEGNAVLVSSHVLTEMAQLADEAIVISRGRLIRQAPLSHLASDSRELVVVTPEAGRLAAALLERGLEVQMKDGELHVSGADAARVGMIAFETRAPVLGLAEKQGSLEDAFLELTEEDAR
jgi:ABC-2 type transport system ATP-binding protein